LFDVVLHCRERAATRAWVNALKNMFETFPQAPFWFVRHVMNFNICSWFRDFLYQCSDQMARSTFVQVLNHAVVAIVETIIKNNGDVSSSALSLYYNISTDELRDQCMFTDNELNEVELMNENMNVGLAKPLLALLVKESIEAVLNVPSYSKYADEVFMLIRELAAIPFLCTMLLDLRAVSLLAFFASAEIVSPEICKIFADKITRPNKANSKHDYYSLLQSVFEALAAPLTIPYAKNGSNTEPAISATSPAIKVPVVGNSGLFSSINLFIPNFSPATG
jgi:hypothetical protein